MNRLRQNSNPFLYFWKWWVMPVYDFCFSAFLFAPMIEATVKGQ
jgi:hypothetical protein